MTKLNIGFIGFGTIAQIHLTAVLENRQASLVAIAACEKVDLPNVNFYYDYKEMLEKEKLDVVHILTPHYLHCEMIKYCNQKNINIICEKPIAIYDYQFEELSSLKANKKIACVLQNRFNTTFLKLQQELVNQNIIGMKGILTWSRKQSYYDEKPWRGLKSEAGSGLLYNQAIHTIDLITLLGGPIKKITSCITNLSLDSLQIEDSAIINFSFENKCTALVMATNSYCDNSSVLIEVITKDYTYNITNHILTKMNNFTLEITVLCKDELLNNQKNYYGPSHKVVINNFYSAIINNTDNYIPLSEGLKPCKIVNEILKQNAK